MANRIDLPLYERIHRKNSIHRTVGLLILFLLLSLLAYHIVSLKHHGIPGLLAFLCECCFTFSWILLLNAKWNLLDSRQYPNRLLKQRTELPAVDIFVTTADAELEPPMLTMNTVLSLLAVDYPAHKLACYLSDDGASPLIYYSLVETSEFAKFWVPFCKKYEISVRAPFQYFATCSKPTKSDPFEYQQEWKTVKDKYELLSHKIEDASRTLVPCNVFPQMDKKNHPTIIKVIMEEEEGLPHLVYISREKHPKHPHHFKAGAMNVLYLGHGLAGIQGPVYAGTNCFHRRKVIYGLLPDQELTSGKFYDEVWRKKLGKSNKLTESAAQILSASACSQGRLSSYVKDATQVAGCGYEDGTCWGTEVGWKYGSATEDVLTGSGIQGKGWRSMYCTTDPPSFLGCAPSCGPSSMTQMKRWTTGLLEVLLSSRSPIFATINGNLQFRQCLAYMSFMIWGLRSIPELIYSLLPAYCIITGSHFLPKAYEPAIVIPVAIVVIYNLYTLYEYIGLGLSTRAWWNNQRMARIYSTSSWLFGFLSSISKFIGLSETAFEVTQKNQHANEDENKKISGKFTFDESPIFVSGTTILLVNLTALVVEAFCFRQTIQKYNGEGIGEMICCLWVVLFYWIFLKGLFGKGKYGIPSATILKSGVLALVFIHFCKWSAKV